MTAIARGIALTDPGQLVDPGVAARPALVARPDLVEELVCDRSLLVSTARQRRKLFRFQPSLARVISFSAYG